MKAMKKNVVPVTAASPLPDPMAEVACFFNAVAPASLLPAAPQGERKTPAMGPALYGRAATDIDHMADLRIRQWIVQQEEDARRQAHKRLFSTPPKAP